MSIWIYLQIHCDVVVKAETANLSAEYMWSHSTKTEEFSVLWRVINSHVREQETTQSLASDIHDIFIVCILLYIIKGTNMVVK